MRVPKIEVTRNYRMFHTAESQLERPEQANRSLKLKKHKALFESLKEQGFLPWYPIVCYRRGGKLIVRDGQHRLAIAEQLNLPVYYLVAWEDFDIAVVNSTVRVWDVLDYAERHANAGVSDYQAAIDFAREHKMPLSTVAALLAGKTSYGVIREDFQQGEFRISVDMGFAVRVATMYMETCRYSAKIKHQRFFEACIAMNWVEGFRPEFFVKRAAYHVGRLLPYSTRDEYLGMIQDIMNEGQSVSRRRGWAVDAQKEIAKRQPRPSDVKRKKLELEPVL
jgi:hypothetical protein